MNTFYDMLDMGDNVTFNLGGQQVAGRVCGVSAHREQNGTYTVSYQVRYVDEKIVEIREEEIIK